VPGLGVNTVEAVWAVGRVTLGPIVRLAGRLHVYGRERVPREGGVVLALNHFSWLDPPAFGVASPRPVYFMAKIEAHRVAGLGQPMRRIVREGEALGLFAEGTRQRSGFPGDVQPGASMVALQEEVPVVCGAIHGSQTWRLGTFHPVSIAWGEPMRFDGLARNARGYREASREIQTEIQRLWSFLVEAHAAGRPRHAIPPIHDGETAASS
jgi:1-acyl-sn-glycerol-3-phosphate acyltransferase